MKRKTMSLKEFCMRYPIQETVLKDVGEKELLETKVWSRSTVYECFKEDAEISFNELTAKEENNYYEKVNKKKANNDIFEMFDVEINGKKAYGDKNCLEDLTKKQILELANAMRNFRDGIIIM